MHIHAQYLQIDQVVFACICQYMHVYASICTVYACICRQQVAGVMEVLCMVSICMYLHVFACKLTVHDRVTVKTAAKLPEIRNCTAVDKTSTGDTFVTQKHCLLLISQGEPLW